MSELVPENCPLCLTTGPREFHQDGRRTYWRCACCELVFVPPAYHLSLAAEKAEYDLHENRVDDPRYRAFLSRVADPLLAMLPPHSHGLDFGCGPGPALAAMLREAGHAVELYDPFFAPDEEPLRRRHAFITATEVVEHLRQPRESLDGLWSILEPEGQLAIMTRLARSAEAFASWHYIRDPSHIAFYSRATFRWLAKHWNGSLTFLENDVMMFKKPPTGTRPVPAPSSL